MLKPKLTIRNNSFELQTNHPQLRYKLEMMMKSLTSYKHARVGRQKKLVTTKDGEYFHFDKRNNRIKFPLAYLPTLLREIGAVGFGEERLNIVDKRAMKFEKIDLTLNTKFTARKYQSRYIKAISGPKASYVHAVDLMPGYGKSLIGSHGCVKNGFRIGVLIKSNYLLKWKDDMMKYINLKDEEVYVIKGKDSIKKLVSMDKSDRKKIKVFIMSIRTISLYINDFVEDDESVPIDPSDLLEFLQIGTVLNDESHQEFESVAKCVMYLAPYRLIGLSATMESDDDFKNYVYQLIYPLATRASNLVEYVKYIHMHTYMYRLNNPNLKHKSHMGYSQVLYEKSIMRDKQLLNDFKEMIKFFTNRHYIKRREKDDKCLLFFGTIDMCTIMTNFLRSEYDDLDVRRYVEDDPYENVLKANLCVSTNQSAGTAIDIPMLITVVQAVCIGSKQANIQALGRLREHEDRVMQYINLFSNSLVSHKKLNFKRVNAVKRYVKNHVQDSYGKTLGGKGNGQNTKFFNQSRGYSGFKKWNKRY